MVYDNSGGPIYSMLTGKSPCGAYGGQAINDTITERLACVNGNLDSTYCRGGVVVQDGSAWCCFGPCVENSDCYNNNYCINNSCCNSTCANYCAAAGYFSMCSDTATSSSPGACTPSVDQIDCFNYNGRYCCCNL